MSGLPMTPESLGELSDEELLSRYRDTNRADFFATLMRRYERELYRYLARYLNDATLADDVSQNTFLQVHLKRALYEDGRPFRPWLYAIATHQAVDALRKTKRRPTVSLDQPSGSPGGETDPSSLVELLVSDDPGPLESMETDERQKIVQAAVARLPETLKLTLILAYYQNLKYREIAEVLEIPVGTVKSRLHAALAKLNEFLGPAQQTER